MSNPLAIQPVLTFEDILRTGSGLDHMFYDNTFIACAHESSHLAALLAQRLGRELISIVIPPDASLLFQNPAFRLPNSEFGIYVATFKQDTSLYRALSEIFPELNIQAQVTVNCQNNGQGSAGYRELVQEILAALQGSDVPAILYQQGVSTQQPLVIRARNLP